MSRRFIATTLVVALSSAPVVPAVRAQERASVGFMLEKALIVAPPAPQVATGREALKLLDDGRRELLRALQERSKRPVEIAVDRATRAVVQMDLDLSLGARSERASQEAAYGFVKTYQELLDPVVVPSDYVISDADGCGSASVVVFDRVVDGVVVLGSKLTLQFSSQGALVGVTNAIASAPREVQPAVEDERAYELLKEAVPAEQLEEAFQKARKVLVPEDAEGRAYLREATLVTWREETLDGPPENKALLYGVQGGLAGPYSAVSPAGLERSFSVQKAFFFERAVTVAAPSYHVDPQTGLTDAISYHDVGGVSVAALPLDRNPYEIVYRFLQEHPSLFRTGVARCQFRPRSIAESKLLPGVQFVRMEQRYAGLRVPGAELVFEIHDKSKVMSVTGHVLPDIEISPVPKLTASAAISAARQEVINALYGYASWTYADPTAQAVVSAQPSAELVVFPGPIVPGRNLATRLAYRVGIHHFVYFIDAETGDELLSHSTRAEQAAPVIKDALAQSELGWLSYVTVQVGPTPTGALALNTDVTPIFGSMSSVAAFYAGLGWFGVNGTGSRLTANTNVAMLTGCANAFFDSFLTGEAFFCLGVGSQPDVVGHEFTHGVIANSSGLVYLDESGALNESYADLFGNLIFPDVISPGATSGWLVGEPPTAGGPAVGTGAIRDMAVPGNFGDPGTMAGFLSRSAAGSGCNLLPISCDSGFVHSNSGIVNRAHVLLAGTPGGAAPPPPIPGIGRAKLAQLAFLVMTTRLTPWSRLVDAAIATEWMARTLVMRGATTTGGVPFVQADVDQVPLAFGLVGLSAGLSTGWSEPTLGFSGVDTFFGSGEPTASGCAITNVQAPMSAVTGQLMADLSPATSEPPAVNFFGVWGIGFSPLPLPGVTLPPIGGTAKTHSISWFNIFGRKPAFYTTIVEAPPPVGAVDCITPVGSTPVQRVSAMNAHWAFAVGGKGDEVWGNPASSMNPTCTVTNTEIELVDNAGNVIDGPGNAVSHTVILGYFFSIPITASRGANLTTPSPTAPPNMSMGVHWWHESGVAVRYRLRYYISQPNNGTNCTSATEF